MVSCGGANLDLNYDDSVDNGAQEPLSTTEEPLPPPTQLDQVILIAVKEQTYNYMVLPQPQVAVGYIDQNGNMQTPVAPAPTILPLKDIYYVYSDGKVVKDRIVFESPNQENQELRKNVASSQLDFSLHQNFVQVIEDQDLEILNLEADPNGPRICDGGALIVDLLEGQDKLRVYEGENCNSAEKTRVNRSQEEEDFVTLIKNLKF